MFATTAPNPPSLSNIVWYCCVVWDEKILEELRAHEGASSQLHNNTSIGKLFSECLKNEGHSFPGIPEMDWKKPFIVVDIITDEFNMCGPHRCLRVQEKVSSDTVKRLQKRPPQWDLVLPEEFNSIAEEMVRMYSRGVKTTVIIWGAYKDMYEQPWRKDSSTTVIEGELVFRRSRLKGSDVLSVIIFHHETLTHERFKLIQGPYPDSELWSSFQNPQLQYQVYIQAQLKDHENPTHLTLHAEKVHDPIVYVIDTEEDDCRVTEFPEIVSAEEEEFGGDDVFEHDIEHDMDDDDDLEGLESASRLGEELRVETTSSPKSFTAADIDVHKLAERIFRRSESLPAFSSFNGASPTNALPNGMVSEEVDFFRRKSVPLPAEGYNGIIGGVEETDGRRDVQQTEDGYQVAATDSDFQYLFSQEVVASDDEEENGPGDNNNELQNSVLNCQVGCEKVSAQKEKQTFPSGPPVGIPVAASVINWGVSSKTKDRGGNQKVCNGVATNAKQLQNGNGGKWAELHRNMNGVVKSTSPQKCPKQKSPVSNTENSEYNFSQLLQEF